MHTAESVINGLKVLADEKTRLGVERFGIPTEHVLGVKVPLLRVIAKEIKRNHTLAHQLWNSGIHEGKLLASMVADPKKITNEEMNQWAKDTYSWDVCDQCCANLFIYTPFWKEKIMQWIPDENEFTRRAGIVLIAESTMHQKKNTSDKELLEWTAEVLKVADDPRNFVKKATSWALRQVGKKRPTLKPEMMEVALNLSLSNDKSSRWIGNDVLRELKKR